ncbi:Calycin-like domain and Calycin domain-containing protein [Aphelenchoides besseyi]|nr:Calycin-like domain and Calycin domain-containing protein [Aphelenchoides besseyi]
MKTREIRGPPDTMRQFVVLLLLSVDMAYAQIDAFALPSGNRYAAKPTIPPEYQKYFELEGHSRDIVDIFTGPRPGGYFPEKPYEVAAPQYSGSGPAAPNDGLAQVGRAIEQFFSGPPSPNSDIQLPPGFNQGFSLNNGNTPLASFQKSGKSATAESSDDDAVKRAPASKSSISGIPNSYPELPKFPYANFNPDASRQPMTLRQTPDLPKMPSRPEVPEGGFGPMNELRRHPVSVSETLYSTATQNNEYGTLTDEPRAPGGLIGTVLDLFGMNKEGKPADSGGIGKAVSNLLTGNNSPLPAKSMISNVLYKALTSGSVQSNTTEMPQLFDFNSSTPITLTDAQQQVIGENLEMIQNLIAQPSSPLCNPKPVPIEEFNIDAFMGQWYQVVYSPPLSQSACSVVSYKKLADVNNGGSGSLFEVFEYTTDGTPYSKAKITSGYAIIKQMGELIFRTTAHQEDVQVHIIATGPINGKGEYDYVIMSTNCNYPVYVFARDPIVYRQRYEATVSQILEQKGIVNGFSKLLNIVAPVDASTCTFPTSLFNMRG